MDNTDLGIKDELVAFATPSLAKSLPTPSKMLNVLDNGEVCIKYSFEEMSNLVAPLRLSLVEKFSHGMLSMFATNKAFSRMTLKGYYNVGPPNHTSPLAKES